MNRDAYIKGYMQKHAEGFPMHAPLPSMSAASPATGPLPAIKPGKGLGIPKMKSKMGAIGGSMNSAVAAAGKAPSIPSVFH
jgi:hypothetical protein